MHRAIGPARAQRRLEPPTRLGGEAYGRRRSCGTGRGCGRGRGAALGASRRGGSGGSGGGESLFSDAFERGHIGHGQLAQCGQVLHRKLQAARCRQHRVQCAQLQLRLAAQRVRRLLRRSRFVGDERVLGKVEAFEHAKTTCERHGCSQPALVKCLLHKLSKRLHWQSACCPCRTVRQQLVTVELHERSHKITRERERLATQTCSLVPLGARHEQLQARAPHLKSI